jgi:glycosyltransferase involved in cell wall biosynthesis
MEGVRQRGIRLQQMGHTVEVVTLDDPAQPFVASYPLRVHALGPSQPGYGYNARLVPWLAEHAHGYDAVIVNGLWQYHSLAAWRALHGGNVPYFVFTHGMLDPWFKRTYRLKHLKKWLYWPWADYRVLRDAAAVLFTSEDERLLARQSFWLYRANERVVAYGTSTPPGNAAELRTRALAAHPELAAKRVLLFLSRIHEKKGCDLLIRAFADVAGKDKNLQLMIAGPDQTGWVAELKRLAQQLGVAHAISWPGMLSGDDKWGVFHLAEVFVLPSHQENFGIAVAEALGCGLPVLISDKVNIWREVQAQGAGLVQPDTYEGTRGLLRQWLGMTPLQRAEMGLAAKRLFAANYSVDAMAQSLLSVVAAETPVAAIAS